MSVTMQDSRASPRSISDQLKRFVQFSDTPATANGASLSDAGFALISLKDHILAEGPRSLGFSQEFVNRPINGMELLSKVVMVLQGMVNVHGNNSKLTSFLSRTSNNANRKRKAAVAEADCIECMKILLEKTDSAWRFFLESATGLDAVLNSVHSPQLDSKCYALEILLLLLDQPQGFVVFFRAITAQAGRNRDYLRLSSFVAQMKHGLHTNKLHIQILVVRLFNKILSSAPTQTHLSLAKTEMGLVHFSTEYVDKLIGPQKSSMGGLDTLNDELAIWRALYGSSTYGSNIDTHLYGISENESDTTHSDRGRRTRLPVNKYPTGTTTVVKNVERQRFKKQGMGSGGRASGPTYYPLDSPNRQSTAGFYPDRRALTLSSRWNGDDSIRENQRVTYATTERRPDEGGMRRAKSESAMLIDDREEMLDSLPRGLKRYHKEQPLYHPIQHSKPISRSVHDLSYRVDSPSTLARTSLLRPSSAAARSMGHLSPSPMSPGRDSIDARPASPPRHRYASPTSPRTRFAEPAVVEAQQPHGGFSYLFPSQPVVASVVPKRAITPEPAMRQNTMQRTTSAPLYATAQSPISRAVSPNPRHERMEASSPVYTENGQVVYIPINMSDGTRITKTSRPDYPLDSRSSSRMRSPSINGDDVRDALSRFDYLNDYDQNSLRKEREVSYHF